MAEQLQKKRFIWPCMSLAGGGSYYTAKPSIGGAPYEPVGGWQNRVNKYAVAVEGGVSHFMWG